MKGLVAVLDALIERAGKEHEEISRLERRKGPTHFSSKQEGLIIAREKVWNYMWETRTKQRVTKSKEQLSMGNGQ
jgi:hypothetical protein